MSDTHEPSYYEIALTNRQVVVAFVVLLTCLLTAFFSGVWVGRGGAKPAAEAEIRTTPPVEQREAAALEEFDFFEDGGKNTAKNTDGKGGAAPAPAPGRKGAAGTPPPAAPPAGEQAFEDEADAAPDAPDDVPDVAPPPAAVPGNPAGNPAAAAAGAGSEREARRRRRAAEREAERALAAPAPQPEVVKPRRLPEAAAPAPVAEPAAGAVVIQVFASPDKTEAERIRDRLKGGGQRAYLSPVEVAGRTMYRVRIGPFSSKDDAQKVAERVRTSYKLDTWVTQ